MKEDETSPSGEDASGKPYISSGSVDFDTTQNLYIEGDNLKVLKLLRETYLGKVKMIYIDPPYNTGNDFVYEDDFTIKSDEWSEKSGDYDEEGNRLVKNLESNGRFHTDWLNMIYPRLRLARDLLNDDGVIFISIDDNEQANLKKICDEIFGEDNFIGLLSLLSNPRGSQNSRHLSYVHEYIIVYAKNEFYVELSGISKSDEAIAEFNLEDNKGKYRLLGLRKRGGAWRKEDRPMMFYPIFVNPLNGKCSLERTAEYCVEVIPKRPTGELSRWCWGKEKFNAENDLLVGKPISRASENNAWDIFRKDYLYDASGTEKTTKVKTIWLEKESNYQNAKNEIKELFGNSEIFDFPKPTYIIKKLAMMITNIEEQDIVLDFFSGSATTAQAIMQLNAADGYNRHFILVQLPETCKENTQAFKAGYKNICEIGKERIRRAGRKILELSLESLEKEGVIEKYAGKLSEIRSLEEVYGAGGTSLSADKPVAKRGNVRLSRPNATGSGFNSVEHSRRTGSGDTGIYPIFESGEGLTSGAGNTIVTMRSLEILNMLGYRVCVECIRGDQQNDIFSDYTSKLQALNSKLSLDTGFRVLKLDSSNMQDVYYNPQKISQTLLDATIDNVKPDRSPLDLLFQVMLELGVPLSAKIEEHTINGKTYFAVNGNDVIACFDDNIDNDVITAIAKQQPLYAVFKDKSFASDSVAINNEQLFKTYSPTTIIKVV